MARTVRVIVTPEFLVDFFKQNRNFRVVDGLPEDAKLVDVMYNLASNRFELVCTSSEFEDHSAEEAPVLKISLKVEDR